MTHQLGRMELKPAKSRVLVGTKRKVTDKFCLSVRGTSIPSVTEKPAKSLGKMFDSTLKNTSALQATSSELGTWLTAVHKSGLPGKFKAWIHQHGILPRLFWLLLVYELPLTTVEGFKRMISHYLAQVVGAAFKPQ